MALTRAIDAFLRCMGGLGGSILMVVRESVDSPGLDFCFEGESCKKVVKGSVEEFVEWREFEELASILDLRYDWRTPDGGIALFFPGALTPERTK